MDRECRRSITRNGNVGQNGLCCPVNFKKVSCSMSIRLKKGCVAEENR